ncbi:hypothetical protein RhiXN_03278 [Rhizoctonia solani]|uniref:Uncharacterized protein n=1 Tax=Rhizoctonia solani TaxID=456999 RepID=A0A8H8SUD0_9AGAM|nr:uncharacterized protein RhiXN_03278 [Rhizoctonia solani]QRW18354.1 hypothetical protein RhiXN_03278 [Rhizoctonia solani]
MRISDPFGSASDTGADAPRAPKTTGALRDSLLSAGNPDPSNPNEVPQTEALQSAPEFFEPRVLFVVYSSGNQKEIILEEGFNYLIPPYIAEDWLE